LRGSILTPIKKTIEKILHGVVLIVAITLTAALTARCGPALVNGRLFLKNLRGSNIYDGGFDARDNPRK
jgi:hypothetical protein